MKSNKRLIFVFLILIIPFITAWTPPSNIDGMNYYTLLNFTNISAEAIYQNGSLLLANESILNVNSSTFWGVLDSISVWFQEVGTTLDMNTTQLNTTVDLRNEIYNASITTYIDNQDTIINTSVTEYADNLDLSQNSSLTNYIDGRDEMFNISITEYADNQFITLANESNLNVNSSSFWGILDDIDDFFTRIGTVLGFNTTKFNETYDAKYTATYNASYAAMVNQNLSLWNESRDKYNATYAGYANNISINYSDNTFTMWDAIWTATYNVTYHALVVQNDSLWLEAYNKYNATYDGYAFNVSSNWSLLTFAMWDSRWTSSTNNTYNATYAGYAGNVSLNYSDNTFAMWNDNWTATYNVTYHALVVQNDSLWLEAYNKYNASYLERNASTDLNMTGNNIWDVNKINTDATNLSIGGSINISTGNFLCFNSACTHYITLNSTGALIIV